jgi:hypothetical protein
LAGQRVYEFVAISDAYYKDVPLYNTSYRLEVRPLPKGKFTDTAPLYICSENALSEATVELEGQAPFTVSYSMYFGNEKQAFLLDNIATTVRSLKIKAKN